MEPGGGKYGDRLMTHTGVSSACDIRTVIVVLPMRICELLFERVVGWRTHPDIFAVIIALQIPENSEKSTERFPLM